VGTPTWPIHAQIFAAAGLAVETYSYFNVVSQRCRLDEIYAALERAQAGDLFLLHGCCHNPTGADLPLSAWREIAAVVNRRGVVPLVDIAYQGLGAGLESDAAGLRLLLGEVDQAIVAYSCDKNFGLYRERTGALFVRPGPGRDTVWSNLLAIARCLWSMPPDHGAAAVRTILASDELTLAWRRELEAMRWRLEGVRRGLSEAHPRLAPLRDQAGLFALLPLNPDQVERMRREFAVYMAGSGRINVAGLTPRTLRRFAEAFAACLPEDLR
jgi:aromatic-amino-acid transaminase